MIMRNQTIISFLVITAIGCLCFSFYTKDDQFAQLAKSISFILVIAAMKYLGGNGLIKKSDS